METQPNSNIETQNERKEIDLESVHRVQKLKILEMFHQGETKRGEAMAEFQLWNERLETWATADPTLRRGILFEIAKSDFYLAVGDTEGALECLDAASLQAQQEGHFDLQDAAEERITVVLKVSKSISTESQ